MKKILSLTAAIAMTATACGTVLVFTGEAEAKKTLKWEYTNSDKCYKSVRVPATVEYNTKGKLKSAASRSWVGNPQNVGSIIRDKHNDAVYFQTRTVIEEQHITLVPVSC